MTKHDKTVDPTSARPSTHAEGADEEVVVRVCFHSDLRRVGRVAVLGAAGRSTGDVVLGRDQPLFDDGAPLADPCVSRRQVSIAWDAPRRRFRIAAHADARRELSLYDATLAPVTAGSLVPPGTFFAIGDRALLVATLRRPGAQGGEGLSGASRVMEALRERVAQVAALDETTLVLGESGTGKELVARALHRESRRREHPFLPVNCAALPEALIESELFGHARGAFSGAAEARPGIFAAADGGTVLLDEIAEVPLALQAKLLRVLQERAVRPVGAAQERPVDVRVIAATHRELAGEVAEGRFREDLFARLDGLVVRVPPLRERAEDVPELFAAAFLERAAGTKAERFVRAADAHPPRIPLRFVLELMRRRWPRNVRELLRFTAGVVADNLAGGAFVEGAGEPTSSNEPEADDGRARPAAAEILRVLEEHDFVQQRAAAALGVSHTTLDRWRRELGIVRPRDVPDEEIERALAAEKGDVDAAARRLRISARGLRLRLKGSTLGKS